MNVTEKFEAQQEPLGLGNEEDSVDSIWMANDLVIESICMFLSVEDLKSLRLASKRLSRGAARILAKKAVVSLTSKTLAGQEVSIVANSIIVDDFLEDCKCLLDSGMHRYFSVDHESFPCESDWETGFRPRKLSLLGCAVAYRLSPEQFCRVEELEITRYNGASGIRLLQNVAVLFPRLKSVTFKKIQPHCWVKFAKCGCSFCMGYMGDNVVPSGCYRRITPDADRFVTLDEDESTGTSEPYAAIPLTDEQRRAASKLPLTKLSFEVSPHSNEYDWEITKYFSRLEALEIKSFQDRSLMAMEWNHNLDFVDSSSIWFARVSSYVDCLKSIFCHLPTSSIRHVSLKCGPGDPEILQKLLNQLRPHTVSLEIVNFYPAFLPGLKNHIMEAMDTLHINRKYSQSFLQLLYTTRFFSKSRWTLVFEGRKNDWMRMEKTETYFMLQERGHTSPCPWRSLPVYWEIDTLMRLQQPSLPNYSYAFHRYGTTNGFEILRPELLFHRNLLEANWMRIKDFICATCKSFPRLLVDLPKFRQEANISFPNPPPCDTQHFDRAWTFYAVPQNVLTTWTRLLDLEIAAAKPTRTCCCCCRSWEAATKFGRAYPSSLPNPEEPEPQVAYDPSLDRTMESHGYSQSESLGLTSQQATKGEKVLVIEGVDTIATVWLKGVGNIPDDNIQEATLKVGFREIHLNQDFIDDTDEETELLGRRFEVVVNGVPIYSKGSNSIPIHVLPENATDEATEWLIKSAQMTGQLSRLLWTTKVIFEFQPDQRQEDRRTKLVEQFYVKSLFEAGTSL